MAVFSSSIMPSGKATLERSRQKVNYFQEVPVDHVGVEWAEAHVDSWLVLDLYGYIGNWNGENSII